MKNSVRRQILGGLLALPLLAAPLLAPRSAWAADDKPVTLVVRFTIQDYAAWRPVFDGADAERVKASVTDPKVFRNADKPNEMMVLFTVASRAAGMAWMRSPQVREAWKKGGVEGNPVYRFLK